ncbi:hypothetical protein OAU50_06185 [Planctomycetota bacterium]|nr:hypothetical protein [Planctomycetota bacterium]
MRKGILLSLLCMISILTVACGGGNDTNGGNAAGNGACGGGGCEAAADPMAFYKTEGNFTLTKTTSKMKMGEEWKDQAATFTRSEITKVDGNKVTVTTTTYDADMKEISSNPFEMDLTPKDPPACAPEAPETTEEEVEVKAGKFTATKTVSGTTTTWQAKGVTVKTEMKMDTMESVTELQEYKIG